jgi:hypothetical protein
LTSGNDLQSLVENIGIGSLDLGGQILLLRRREVDNLVLIVVLVLFGLSRLFGISITIDRTGSSGRCFSSSSGSSFLGRFSRSTGVSLSLTSLEFFNLAFNLGNLISVSLKPLFVCNVRL